MAHGRVRYSDGKSAAVHFVDLLWREHGLDILANDGNLLDHWCYDDIREMPMPGRDDCLQIIGGHGVGSRLRLEDLDVIVKCRQHCTALNQLPGKEPGWWKAYAFWSVTAVASLIALFWIVIPGLSHQISRLIPYSWEQELGLSTEDSIISLMAKYEDKSVAELSCDSPKGLKALSKLSAPLIHALDNQLDIQVRVIDTDMVNAFALPGGRIVVFRGLLDKADHPNELSGVLGHEIGHVVYHHGMEGFISTTAITGLISLLVGDASGGIVMAGFLDIVVNSANSREAEFDADSYGLAVLDSLSLDHEPMERMLAKLGGETPETWVLDWLSSHPGIEERIAKTDAAPSGSKRSLNAADWQALKNICN